MVVLSFLVKIITWGGRRRRYRVPERQNFLKRTKAYCGVNGRQREIVRNGVGAVLYTILPFENNIGEMLLAP